MRFRSESETEDTELDWIDIGGRGAPAVATDRHVTMSLSVAGLAFATLLIGLFVWASTDDSASDSVEQPTPTALGREETLAIAEIPRPLVAAELFHASPSFETVNRLFDAIGGIEGATIGSAEGNFDLVTFNPLDNDQLLASVRSSYGLAENQLINESWTVTDGDVLQQLNAAELPHDYAHFNPDGSTTFWSRGEPTIDYTSRIPTIFDERGTVDARSPIFAGRAIVVDGTLFALTDSPDYGSNRREYDELVADDGGNIGRLDSGAAWARLDSPSPGIVAAYPTSPDGRIALWDAASLDPIDGHPLARQSYQGAAISGDGKIAIAIDFDGQLDRIDLETGEITLSFGSVDPGGIAAPISLNHDGTIALTVDRRGVVSMWWVDDGVPIFVADGDSGPARVLGERRAARTSSVVADDASRVALRFQTPVTWSVVETSPDRWVARACELAGRGLTETEAMALGIPIASSACPTR